MATTTSYPEHMSALSNLFEQPPGVQGVQFDASTLKQHVAPSSKEHSALWKRSQNPTIGTDNLNAFQRSDKKRQELMKDPRLQELYELCDKSARQVRKIDNYALVEQMDRENGILGPRQDVTMYGPGTDSSRWTGGMSDDEKAKHAHLHATREQVTEALEQAVHGFEYIDPSTPKYASLYKSKDGKEGMLKVTLTQANARHEEGVHNVREGYQEYMESLRDETASTKDFGDYYDYDFHDPRGTQMGLVQSITAAKSYYAWAKENDKIPDMIAYGGLFRQWETARALAVEMVANGHDCPVLVCRKDLNENGHSGGVCQIGELDTNSAFLGDKTAWENNSDQTDAEIYTHIAAGKDALMEAVKQIADWKASVGKFNKDGSVPVTIANFSSCERMGHENHYSTGQGGENGGYIRQGNAEYRVEQQDILLDQKGNKYVGPSSDVYSRPQIGPGFNADMYRKIFGEDPLVGHSTTDHSSMAYKSTLRDILPGRETQLNSACKSFRKSMALQKPATQRKLASMLGASDTDSIPDENITDSITDEQIKTHIKKQRQHHQSRKQQRDLAALQAVLQSILSSQQSSGDASSIDSSTRPSQITYRDTACGSDTWAAIPTPQATACPPGHSWVTPHASSKGFRVSAWLLTMNCLSGAGQASLSAAVASFTLLYIPTMHIPYCDQLQV